MSMTERDIQAAIFRAIGGRRDVRLFRNNVGAAWTGRAFRERDAGGGNLVTLADARRIEFGLHPGSPDLVGVRLVTITPDMVGHIIGQFVGLEIKTPTGRVRPEQIIFLEMLEKFGAAAGIARSVEDAEKILQKLQKVVDGNR